MLTRLHSFIVDCSQSWWKTLLLVASFGLTMWQLQAVTAAFPGLATDPVLGDTVVPFDMQNGLTTNQLFAQLAVWSEQSFAQYYWFQFVDFFFPLAGGLMSAALAAIGLRLLSDRYYDIAVSKNLFLVFLIATCFDWLENTGFLLVLAAWPEQAMNAANFAILAKKCKLATLFAFQPVWIGLFLAGTVKWLYRKARPA